MSSNTMGKHFALTCFGESHGRCVGVVVDGCTPGLPLSVSDVQAEVDRRRPASEVSTSRREEDKVEILSGIFNGHATGAPICMLVWNREAQSGDYEEFRWRPRPGHADFPASVRYRGFNDYRGGGRFSGRLTVAFVMAGAVAKKLLREVGIEVLAHTVEVAGVGLAKEPTLDEVRANVYANTMRCADLEAAKKMEKAVLNAKKDGDSVGGVVECIALNLPVGVGEPIFGSLDSDIAKALFNIPAVKGVEFGAGFKSSRMRGSENNDQYVLKEGKVVSLMNNAGGILGGLSTGMPIVARIGFKPTPSISRKQRTVDLKRNAEVPLEVGGRHDACIVPRAVPVVESMMAVILADHLIGLGMVKVGK